MKKIFSILAVVFVLFASTAGALTYFAKATDLDQVAMRLDKKIKSDEIWFIKKQLFQLYNRYDTKDCMKMDCPDCDICRELKHKLEELSR